MPTKEQAMPNGVPHTSDIVVDVYHKNTVDFSSLKQAGIVGIVHKASQGVTIKDEKYRERRDQALDMGFLWGAYHFSSADDVQKQVKNFIEVIEWDKDSARDARTLLSLDFEPSGLVTKKDKDGKPVIGNDGKPVMVPLPDMTLAQANEFVTAIKKITGRYPMVYGGHLLRESVKNANNTIPLAKCPLWYARYGDTPKGLPVHIWPAYTLWQYSDGKRGLQPRTVNGKGIDRDTYLGTADDLREKWPFATV
jgi:lysozyme